MKSIRSKITFFTILLTLIAIVISTTVGIIMIRNLGKKDSEQMLALLCETGEKNLDSYFESVEKSVETVSEYAQEDLNNTELTNLDKHMEKVSSLFEKIAINTNGVLTYYYRIEPNVSDTINGFWYIKTTDGYVEHEVTDLSEYDLNDTNSVVWYTVPRNKKVSIWLPPYITENLGARVFSYNVPIMKDNEFFGVIGIEIEYSTVAEQVNNIKLFDNGYAFINDSEGNIVYHPFIDVTTLEVMPKVPDGMLSNNNYFVYTYEGVEKEAYWLPLSNGMKLNVSVPVSEANGNWGMLLIYVLSISGIMLMFFMFVSYIFSGFITRPITNLVEGALEVNRGNYDVKLRCNRNDEIGLLTNTFNNLIVNLKKNMLKLSKMAYGDSLTSVNNRGAFDEECHELQKKIDSKDSELKFAIAIFDCDNLKVINDKYGHKAGDAYLKNSCGLISITFEKSKIYRIGGDEFAAILYDEDYKNRDNLMKQFHDVMKEINKNSPNKWNEIHLSYGMSFFNPENDQMVEDVIDRADEIMYQYKDKNKEKIV